MIVCQRCNERVLLDDVVSITVLVVDVNRVQLRIDAPPEMRIVLEPEKVPVPRLVRIWRQRKQWIRIGEELNLVYVGQYEHDEEVGLIGYYGSDSMRIIHERK